MILPLVAFEQAVILKEVGFNIPCHNLFVKTIGKHCDIHREQCSNWNNMPVAGNEYISRPEVSLVLLWLRAEHGILVEVIYCEGLSATFNMYRDNYDGSKQLIATSPSKHATYDEAEVAGMREAILLLKHFCSA